MLTDLSFSNIRKAKKKKQQREYRRAEKKGEQSTEKCDTHQAHWTNEMEWNRNHEWKIRPESLDMVHSVAQEDETKGDDMPSYQSAVAKRKPPQKDTTLKVGKYVNLRHCFSFPCGLHFGLFVHRPRAHRRRVTIESSNDNNNYKKASETEEIHPRQSRSLVEGECKMYRFQWVPEFRSFSRFRSAKHRTQKRFQTTKDEDIRKNTRKETFTIQLWRLIKAWMNFETCSKNWSWFKTI